MAGKVVFAVVFLLLSSLILFGGGGLMFRIRWQHPLFLGTLIVAYALFASSLMAVLVALVPDERRASVLNNLAGMGLGLAGGCAFPPQGLPAFLRDHITPRLPTYWFTETVRGLQSGGASAPWLSTSLQPAGVSLLLLALAALLFRRRFKTGAGA